MSGMIKHRTARVPNEPFRMAGLTLPQVIAVTGSFTLAVVLWWVLGLEQASGLGFFFVRSIGCGLVAGLLGLLAYAAFDPRREPLVRQALGYPFRRHVYRREEILHDSTIVGFHAGARTTKTALAHLARASRYCAACLSRAGRRTR